MFNLLVNIQFCKTKSFVRENFLVSDNRINFFKFSNPLDLSITTTMTAEECPLDLSIGPNTSNDSVKAIDLALPRNPEKKITSAVPLDLRITKFKDQQIEGTDLDKKCNILSPVSNYETNTSDTLSVITNTRRRCTNLKREYILKIVDSPSKKKSELDHGISFLLMNKSCV